MNKLLLYISILVGSFKLSAQDLQNFYLYSLDWSNINNAYIGTNRSLDWLVMTRTQYNSIANSPKNLVGLMHAGISENQGLGIKIISDNRGAFNTTRFDAIYAQRFNFSGQNYVRFGMSFGALNSNIDLSKLANGDMIIETGDPVPSSSLYNYTHFVSGFGMIAGINQFEFGISAPHLVVSNVGFEPFLFTTAKYRYSLRNSPITLVPAVIYQNRPERENVIDGFLTVSWKEFVSLISGYTSDSRLRFGVGLNYKNLGISYLNESPTGSTALSNSANEIAIRLRISKSKPTEVVDMKSEIQKLLDETVALLGGDYDRAYLKKRMTEIDRQLDLLLAKNSSSTAVGVSKELDELEKQLLLLIEKYNLTNE